MSASEHIAFGRIAYAYVCLSSKAIIAKSYYTHSQKGFKIERFGSPWRPGGLPVSVEPLFKEYQSCIMS